MFTCRQVAYTKKPRLTNVAMTKLAGDRRDDATRMMHLVSHPSGKNLSVECSYRNVALNDIPQPTRLGIANNDMLGQAIAFY